MTDPIPEPLYPLQNPIFDGLETIKSRLIETFAEVDALPGVVVIEPGFDPLDLVGSGEGEDCSQAWVRLLTGLSQSAQTNASGGSCAATITFQVEVGLLRCIEMPEMDESYDPDELEASAAIQISDMLLLHGIIRCGDLPITDMEYIPQGPLGGFVGGVWVATISVNT